MEEKWELQGQHHLLQSKTESKLVSEKSRVYSQQHRDRDQLHHQQSHTQVNIKVLKSTFYLHKIYNYVTIHAEKR